MQYQLNGVTPLAHLGVIRVAGEDATKFLHGQLTQDFSALGLSEARLAAFCSAKGRMQASFIGFKRGDTEILLVCSRDVLAATLKRLSMFVLRAKAGLSDASDDFVLYGLAGDAVEIATKQVAAYADAVWAKVDFDQISLVNLYPADGIRRALWLAPAGANAPAGQVLSLADWQWGEVRGGIASITAPIVDAFVPQMLNYESVGGVNFKKGCYPGQEVVARSQFRGTLKRRAYLAHSDAPMKAGDEVFQAMDASQPCGSVAQSAAAPIGAASGGFEAIVSLQVAAFEAGDLHLGSADGPPLSVAPPPYPLLADI
jgi:hypothetical protein